MPRVEVPFVGGAYAGRSLNQNPQECVNFFLETDQEGGKSPIALYGTPGLKTYKDTATSAEIRGMVVCDGKLYVVAGQDLLQITTALTMTDLGNLSTSTGPVRMAENGLQAMVVDGTDGYVYTLATAAFAQVADTDFPGTVLGLACLDSYGIVTEKNTDNFWWSKAEDFTDWTATDFSSADGLSDYLLAVLSDHRELWLFKQRSTEVWYNSGSTETTFERVQGAFLEKGIAGSNCAAKLDNSVYWLTNEGVFVRAEGYNPQIVSTRQIEYLWSQYTSWSDAIVFGYHWQGHAFIQITFPTDGKTWVYDASNGFWHRRVSYPRSGTGVHGRHRANCYAYFDGKHLVGDFENGIIYEMDDDTYTDNSQTIHRWRTTQIMNEKDVNLFVHSLQVDFEAGTGLVTGQGSIPQAMLQLSRDSGHTWSNEYWVVSGKMGEYARRAIWRRLGVGRNLTARVELTDPVKWIITGAVAEVTAGQY